MSKFARLALAFTALLGVGLGASASATAPRPTTVTVTVSLTSVDTSLHRVGPQNTRLYGANHLIGTGTDSNGAPVDVELLALVNYTNGSGRFEGQFTLTFANGDTLGLQAVNGATLANSGGANFTSQLKVIDGTGGLLRSKGTGTFLGSRTSVIGSPVQSTLRVTISRA